MSSDSNAGAMNIQEQAGARIRIADSVTDIQKGMPGLAALVKASFGKEPYGDDAAPMFQTHQPATRTYQP